MQVLWQTWQGLAVHQDKSPSQQSRVRPAPCKAAAEMDLLPLPKHPAVLRAVFLQSTRVILPHYGAALLLLMRGCMNVTQGSFSLASAIV